MNDILNGHEEIQALLGVYALDAVTPAEHDAVTRHLAGCDECRAEVDDHLEVAADLSALAIAPPPSALWDRIVVGLDPTPADDVETPPRPSLRVLLDPATATIAAAAPDAAPVSLEERRARRSSRRTLLSVASIASVAAALIVVLAIGWVQANDRAGKATGELARPAMELAAARALDDPQNRRLELRAPSGDVTAVAVVTPDGEGYFLPRGLSVLPDDRTYQLWQIGSRGPVSLGVFGNEPGVRGFHLQGPVQTLAITNEAAGGRALPEGAPLATATA
jgi:hypothetical protein